ncbi:hypothetical protein SCHPADRAFT_896495, partial [Schizopora paradoxa]
MSEGSHGLAAVSPPPWRRTVKRGKQEKGIGRGQLGDVRPSTPVSPTPHRVATSTLLPPEEPLSSHIAQEASVDPSITQLNTLLQQAAKLALEASHLLDAPKEHLRRTHQLLRTLDSLFQDVTEPRAAHSTLQERPPTTSSVDGSSLT